MFYNEAVKHMEKYLVEGDRGELKAAITCLEQEFENPTIYPEPVYLEGYNEAQFTDILTSRGAFYMADEAAVLSGKIKEDMLCRFITNDQAENTCFILRCVLTRKDMRVFTPVPIA